VLERAADSGEIGADHLSPIDLLWAISGAAMRGPTGPLPRNAWSIS
jgi:hypothetical protein